ncbi:MAG: 2-C-methyl-D-erythritol 4-phosphate cytidylyltransferase, partial [Flavobacteriales bacterium]
MNQWTVIVPSGGVGSRMGSDRPKQYLILNEKPLLIHTLLALDSHFNRPKFIVPLAETWREYLTPFLEDLPLKQRLLFVESGKERYDSVKNALPYLETAWVAVHDAVRPFVSLETTNRLIEAIAHHPAAIPVLAMKESLRKRNERGSEAVDRSVYMSVQTPQCFHASVLVQAYAQPFDALLTDDASLVERVGIPIQCVLGNEENIKITTPTDWLIA